MIADAIQLQNAPRVDGLTFRRFRGEGDYPKMAAVIEASKAVDQIERTNSVEEIAHGYSHLVNCDPHQDMIFAEVDREVISYGRAWWVHQSNGERIYWHLGFLKPAWRRKRIGSAMLRFLQNRMAQVAAADPGDGPRYFQAFVADTELGTEMLLKKHNYTAVRYAFDMVRADLEAIPDFPLPAGLEVRPVLPEHYRQIWEADVEAFKDHWGYSPPTEEDYRAWLSNPVQFTPALWQVAWDVETNQVAGMVRGFINEEENEQYHRKRGWTENISTRRPWRKRGLARALIIRTLRTFKEMGMTESALGVDAQNPTGALSVYEACGFRAVKQSTTYRKCLE